MVLRMPHIGDPVMPDLSGSGCYVAIGGILRAGWAAKAKAALLGVGESEVPARFCRQPGESHPIAFISNVS